MMECFDNVGSPESRVSAENPHNQALWNNTEPSTYKDHTMDNSVPPASISVRPSVSEIVSTSKNANVACATSPRLEASRSLTACNKNNTSTNADSQTNLSVIKLKKEQRVPIKAQKAELKAKRAAKNIEKAELKTKRDAENRKKEEEKREKQQKMEQEMKERREKKELEELEKKERREKREAERKKKEDEKKQKEEERKKKLEEKEQLKEEKLRRENQAKMKFRSFFTEIKKPAVKRELAASHTMLTPFSVKDGMTLATPSRLPLQDTSKFDCLLEDQDSTLNYLQTIRTKIWSNIRTPRSEPTTLSVEVDAESCQAWDGIRKEEIPKFKLVQFHENYRPAYYGSWSKQRGNINPRNPFKMDSNLLDYSMDSDEEWEEEEPGESVSNSEDENKEMDGEEEEDDDGFFVPHGYLSNDEGDYSDDNEDGLVYPNSDFSDVLDLTAINPLSDSPPNVCHFQPQERKNNQLAKANAWEAEFARKCQVLSKKKIGPLWLHPQMIDTTPSPGGSVSCDEAFLVQFAAVSLVPLPIPYPMESKGESSFDTSFDHLHQGSGGTGECMKQEVPEVAMPDLIHFIHKSSMGMVKIIKLFRAHWGARVWKNSRETPSLDSEDGTVASRSHKMNNINQIIDSTPKRNKTHTDLQVYEAVSGISKRQLEIKIRAIAVKEVRTLLGKPMWYVHLEIMKQYDLEEDNLLPLVSDSSSPTLIKGDLPCVNKLAFSADTNAKQRKRKNYGSTSKSLIYFLKTASSSPSPKRVKTELMTTGQQQLLQAKENNGDDDDVIFVKVTSAVDEENLLMAPPAKKLHTCIEPVAVKFEPLAPSGQADHVIIL